MDGEPCQNFINLLKLEYAVKRIAEYLSRYASDWEEV